MNPFPTVLEKLTHTRVGGLIQDINKGFGRIPESLIAALGRFSISAVFWLSGQTKIGGFSLELIEGTYQFGWPHLSDSAIALFRDEYRLPFMSPEFAALTAAFAENMFSVLLLVGFATRFSAAALLVMTLVIEVFVYPDAYPTHGTWITVLLYLMARGGGAFSVDHWLALRTEHTCPRKH